MNEPDVDVLVAGGGLVGLAAACALARAGLRVAIADRLAIGAAAHDAAADSWDPRVYAISPGSARFLHRVGAWTRLSAERMAAIEAMEVCGDGGGSIRFAAYDVGERALAWIVEERTLRAALVTTLHLAGVRLLAPREFAALAYRADRAELSFGDGESVSARLVVGADGVRSWVREASGVAATLRPYGQTAVVANFACSRAHHGIARQWFRSDGGVLAWLPLPGRRMSMVWSAPEALAARLAALPPALLAHEVQKAGHDALGTLVCITPPAQFPLASLRLREVVAPRLVLIGDAAHVVHPLAGQGVNLGFGDADVLSEVLADRGARTDVGTRPLLERYAQRRAEPVWAMHQVTDGLARLFASRALGMSWLRNAGLSGVARMPFLTRQLARAALG